MIKKANYKNIDSIYSLINSGVKSNKVLSRTKKEIKKTIESFYVYEKDRQIIGCCSLEIYNKKLAEIRSLVVLPRYRNQGVATGLIQTCLKKAKEKGIYEILAITDRVSLFGKAGFANCLNNQTALFTRP